MAVAKVTCSSLFSLCRIWCNPHTTFEECDRLKISSHGQGTGVFRILHAYALQECHRIRCRDIKGVLLPLLCRLFRTTFRIPDYQKTQHKKTQHENSTQENSTQKTQHKNTQHREFNTKNSTQKIQHKKTQHRKFNRRKFNTRKLNTEDSTHFRLLNTCIIYKNRDIHLSQPAPGLACHCRRVGIGRGHGSSLRFPKWYFNY